MPQVRLRSTLYTHEQSHGHLVAAGAPGVGSLYVSTVSGGGGMRMGVPDSSSASIIVRWSSTPTVAPRCRPQRPTHSSSVISAAMAILLRKGREEQAQWCRLAGKSRLPLIPGSALVTSESAPTAREAKCTFFWTLRPFVASSR